IFNITAARRCTCACASRGGSRERPGTRNWARRTRTAARRCQKTFTLKTTARPARQERTRRTGCLLLPRTRTMHTPRRAAVLLVASSLALLHTNAQRFGGRGRYPSPAQPAASEVCTEPSDGLLGGDQNTDLSSVLFGTHIHAHTPHPFFSLHHLPLSLTCSLHPLPLPLHLS
ncbi:hypothetical protein T492DRAFT_1122860, partial [Pavlovales sp. CCMP2436]